MHIFGILWPTIVLVALIWLVWGTMFFQRFRHMKRTPPKQWDLDSTESALRYFAPVEMPANNLRNLFEMPVLYFALVPLLLITREVTHVQVALAWSYVTLRAIHSFIHIGPKRVSWRFLVYAASCAVLAAMWLCFAYGLSYDQAVYDEAMGNVLI